jgi:integrase
MYRQIGKVMIHKLAATAVRQAKPKDKAYKMTDGKGLYLLVHPQSGKYWRYDYRFTGKRKTLSLGVFPDVSLSDARTLHQKAREKLGSGIDPSEVKRVDKLTKNLAAADSFEAIGREWFNHKVQNNSENHKVRVLRILEKDLIPSLGHRPISKITAPELLAALRKIEKRGAVDIAHRAKQTSSLIFRYAVATGRAERDPSSDLTGALQSKTKKHHAAITDPKEVGGLMKAIDGYNGTMVVKTALQLSALLFQRPGQIRHMEWTAINWDEVRWEIPAEKMKMRVEHIVPLSTQALDLLKQLQRLTGRGKYVFPNARGASRPLSENGVRAALRTMGYTNDKMTPHGFRAMARTILDEILNFRVDWIEHQLAHAVRDTNGRAYNRTSHLKGRIKMMQGWADYLDNLSSGNNSAASFMSDPHA